MKPPVEAPIAFVLLLILLALVAWGVTTARPVDDCASVCYNLFMAPEEHSACRVGCENGRDGR